MTIFANVPRHQILAQQQTAATPWLWCLSLIYKSLRLQCDASGNEMHPPGSWRNYPFGSDAFHASLTRLEQATTVASIMGNS